jgi:chromate transporter
MILIELFLSFFKIGLFSFGGGYAMISLLQDEAAVRGWMTVAEFTDIVAISQVTPGPIAVNMATFVGFRQAGVFGALLATLGVSMPSFILVTAVFGVITRFKESKQINGFFTGARPAVAALVLAAGMNVMVMEGPIDWRSILIFSAAVIAIIKLNVNMILVILSAAIAGIILYK